MNIALIAHDNRKELMVQFCTAYCGILAQHTLCATANTGKQVQEATGLKVHRFLTFEDRRPHRLQRDRHGAVLRRSQQAHHPRGHSVYRQAVRQEQHPLRQQCGHRRNADPWSGTGRSGLARYRQSQDQALHGVRDEAHLQKPPSAREVARSAGGREFKSFILSPSRGVKKTCRWHVFSPDLGGYAAVADSPFSEGAKDGFPRQ